MNLEKHRNDSLDRSRYFRRSWPAVFARNVHFCAEPGFEFGAFAA